MTTTTLSIPTSRVDELRVRIDKFNRRAVKLSVSSLLKITCGTPEIHKVLDMDLRKINVEFTPVTIEGEIPVLGGWKICSVIDHLPGGAVIIRSVSREETPELYRTRGPICDHCNTNRYRRTTFVLQNIDSGEYTQVGKSCLKDFVNTSIEQELTYLTSYLKLFSEIEEKEYSFGTPDYRVDVLDAFTVAVNLIESYGFVPSQSEYKIPTKSEMMAYYYDRSEEAKKLIDGLVLSYKDAESKASVVIDWIKNSPENNDFFYNLKTIVGQEYINPKYFGFIAGAVAGYNKTQAKAVMEKETIKNEYLDTPIGKRILIENVVVKTISTFDGNYGTTWIHRMLDSEKRSLIWFSSSSAFYDELESGKAITIKATIKAFQEYKGIKQTVLNRVAIN